MEVKSVQYSINTKSKEYKHYLEAEGAVDTTELVKPLPGQGHLVHDNILTGSKYFFKDFAYDIKSLKNGIKGTANDHQLGRLNDVGLELGGIGIATYLASKTTNPKARIMEYAGLAAFLTAMNLYPKIAINKPAELFHGYDIDKWYIDDQGRKKSVTQDSNYVPYDLYRGEAKGEDLDEIGDKMGIPRDIKNRHNIIKEQMRKISIQSNTLWMLTAGLATPVMTALACYGLENYVISPQLEKARNNKYNKLITETLKKTDTMPLEISEIADNDLSAKVSKILREYKGKELPKEGLEYIIEILAENLDNNITEGIKEDLAKTIDNVISLNGEVADKMTTSAKKLIRASQKEKLEPLLIPSRQELEEIIQKVLPNTDFVDGSTTKIENIIEIKKELRTFIDSRIKTADSQIPKKYLENLRNKIIDDMAKTLESAQSKAITDSSFDSIINFAKILGEFKENQRLLDKCHSFKFEFAPETTLALSYSKFEKTLVKELGISINEMKKMRESEEYTVEILNKKITELCLDEGKYKKAFKNLSKVISEMEVNLNGAEEEGSHILNMINAIENNYNNTAKRLSKINGFETTISRLVSEDVSTLGLSVTSRQELFDLLDGIVENKYKMGIGGDQAAYARDHAKGLGSSKYAEITRTIERYQGVKNSFNRILHTFEVFKRTMDPAEFLKTLDGLSGTHEPLSITDAAYIQKLIKKGRETLLTATSADHNLKLDLVNNPIFYRDLMNTMWAPVSAPADEFWSTKAKGYVTDIAKETLEEHNTIAKGSVLDRFQTYITRFRNIVANSPIDFTKPFHGTNPYIRNSYTANEKTNMAFFNLVGQTPVDFIQGASKRQYGTKKWFRLIAGVTTAVFGVTILAQAGFGRIRNPHNIQKQVNDEAN